MSLTTGEYMYLFDLPVGRVLNRKCRTPEILALVILIFKNG